MHQIDSSQSISRQYKNFSQGILSTKKKIKSDNSRYQPQNKILYDLSFETSFSKDQNLNQLKQKMFNEQQIIKGQELQKVKKERNWKLTLLKDNPRNNSKRTEVNSSGIQRLKLRTTQRQNTQDVDNIQDKKRIRQQFLNIINEDNIVPIDPHRVSRYRNSNWYSPKTQQKWNHSVQVYMEARSKMSNFFNTTKRNTGQFEELQLDKKNKMIKNRKLTELKSKSPKKNESQDQYANRSNGFLSHLIPTDRKRMSVQLQNEVLARQIDKSVNRCDAILVNFVSTYFRRKFYKKNRKSMTIKRAKTDETFEEEMVGLQGSIIKGELIKKEIFADESSNY